MDFPGYSIGGLAVGEPQAVMLAMIEEVMPHLPDDKPHYLMGVGTPDDLLAAVARGVDMFDCVMPTRNGRHGQAFTRFGKVNFRNARHADDPRPLDEASSCPAARDYSRAYLHHLVRTEEMLGSMLITWINLAYYQELMAGARAAIAAGRYADYMAEVREGWARATSSPGRAEPHSIRKSDGFHGIFGYCGSIASSVSRTIDAMMALRAHLRSAGTTCQGA